jgi:tRNA-dihydrouridine synthase B
MAESAIRHYQHLLSSMGRDVGLRHARKHVVAYLEEAHRQGSPTALRLRADLCATTDAEAVSDGLYRAFCDIPERLAA